MNLLSSTILKYIFPEKKSFLVTIDPIINYIGYIIIRAAQAVRITVRPVRVLKYINKYIHKILKHALDQKFKYLYYFGPARVLDKIYSIY